MLKDINMYINRSLEIYPDYFSALQMYSGVVGSNYLFDKDLDKALKGFYTILSRRSTITYVDQFLDYLDTQQNIDKVKLKDFYIKVGYEVYYKDKKIYANASKYIGKALKLNSTDPKANYAMYLILLANGDSAKAEQYRLNAMTFDPNVAAYFK